MQQMNRTGNSGGDRLKTSSRMQGAVSMAKSQPSRPTQPGNNNGGGSSRVTGQIDPQWQQKVAGSRLQPSSVFRPTSTPNLSRGESNFSSSSVGNTNRRRPGAATNAFDAKAFLRTQQKGQFLNPTTATSTGAGGNVSSQQTAPWQPKMTASPQQYSQQYSPSMDPKAFDIERFKASQPRRSFAAAPAASSPVAAARQTQPAAQQQQQQARQQRQQQRQQRQQQRQQPAQEEQEPAQEEQDTTEGVEEGEDAVALPWQTAKQNLAARGQKTSSSKEVLLQMAALRDQTQQKEVVLDKAKQVIDAIETEQQQ